MAWVKRKIPKCDLCGHEWIPSTPKPTHCAKCKSRLWNGSTSTAQRQIQSLKAKNAELKRKLAK